MRVLTILLLLCGLAHADITLGSVTIRNSSNSSVGSVDSDGTSPRFCFSAVRSAF